MLNNKRLGDQSVSLTENRLWKGKKFRTKALRSRFISHRLRQPEESHPAGYWKSLRHCRISFTFQNRRSRDLGHSFLHMMGVVGSDRPRVLKEVAKLEKDGSNLLMIRCTRCGTGARAPVQSSGWTAQKTSHQECGLYFCEKQSGSLFRSQLEIMHYLYFK